MGRCVMRNNLTRDDAVYIVEVEKAGDMYIVRGLWGKWSTFLNNPSRLQSKEYYNGRHKSNARIAARNLRNKKERNGYRTVHEECITLFPSSETPQALLPERARDHYKEIRSSTVAGLIEFD